MVLPEPALLPDWMPSAKVDTLRIRAGVLGQLRAFFLHRNVLEVETPALSQHSVTDVHLDAMQAQYTDPSQPHKKQLYLQTSPEFAMKRLLCAGSGCIYQICKSFRDDERGTRHNPEFTMLEWYRVGFTMQMLIDEVVELLQLILDCQLAQQVTYSELFQTCLGFDPLTVDLTELCNIARSKGFANIVETVCEQDSVSQAQTLAQDTDLLLNLLFSHCIEPTLGFEVPVVVTHFPVHQAALAKVCPDNPMRAMRFEVYAQGLELANGYEELQDSTVQVSRMQQDNAERASLGKATRTIDPHLISALRHGLPACSGVALGIDRLLMLKTKHTDIAKVLSFDIQRA